MAVVYRIKDRWFDEERALKVLLPHASRSERTRTRFLQEARTMARLNHPNVVRIHDVGQDGDRLYFAMELCKNSLARHLRLNGPCKPGDALQYIFGVLKGLSHAHTAGVVHRDMKPHNMLFGVDDQMKLTDFGIARVLAMSNDNRITGTGDTLGTIAYMAPEQRLDPRNAGPEADIYGAGATLYVLITGRRPFDLAMVGLDPTVMARLPAPLRPVVRCSTAHRPEDRYVDARAMASAVADAWADLDPATPAAARMDIFDLDADNTVLAAE
jgi:serine/threonine-protein kinase